VPVVPGPEVHSDAGGAPAIQCAGGGGRDRRPVADGDEHGV